MDATQIGLRLPPDNLAAVDAWISGQSDPTLSRPEAIRRLVELGLTVKPKARLRAPNQKDRARELAAKVIDKIIATNATEEDKVVRKQQLLKGPSMLRDVRVDRPKRTK